jgi:hypothetical protein
VYSTQWSRLDNAAKIFPPSTSKVDTKVFRFSCELYEAVDAVILQHALDESIEHFPFYRFIIRRGFFWYYFERSDLKPEVREEYKPPCAPLYNVTRKNLLFELTYYRNRINLEIYHALSDGIGALQFLKAIVYYYLLEKHRETLDRGIQLMGNEASDEQRSRDAFDQYYSKRKTSKLPRLPKAYRITGEQFSESRFGIIEGHLSTAAILRKTHEHNATLGEFLTALLMCAIHEGMTIRDEAKPVSITIPVDLRKFFATPSARNFFSIINVSHDFSTQGKDFESVLAQVKQSFKTLLTEEKILERFNQLTALEHTLPIRVVPLAVKVPVMRNAAYQADLGNSAALSNIGKITMPGELIPHIKLFDVFFGSRRPHICICSFQDNLVITFSSSFVSSDVQRTFFRSLASLGCDVEIISNTAELREAPNAVLH